MADKLTQLDLLREFYINNSLRDISHPEVVDDERFIILFGLK